MNEDSPDQVLEGQLRQALGSPAKADFESWQNRHADAVAYLNPVVTELSRRRKRMVMRIANVAAAALIILSVLSWFLVSEGESFAQAVQAIDDAQTLTWNCTNYERIYSRDGKRTWLRTRRLAYAYQHPGIFRQTRYDDEGNVSWVILVDSRSGETLSLDMKKKKINSGGPVLQAGYHPQGPFGWVADVLKTEPLELVGQRTVNDRIVNVIRCRRDKMRPKERNSLDIWIDAQTKHLIGFSDPGADVFDPSAMPDRDNPAEEKMSKGEMLGSVVGDIVFDAKLDAELFSLTPPEGFEIVEHPPRPSVTEAELIEWLGITARVNNDTFIETTRATDSERIWAALKKKVADRYDVETKLGDVWLKHMKNGNRAPIWDFRDDNTVAGSFRYVGKGVKLGSADRIVCWYKLKSTGKHRAVFGDLTIKDVDPKDLPLPVDE